LEKLEFPRYKKKTEDIGEPLTEGVYAVRQISIKHSDKYNQDFAVLKIWTPEGEQTRHTFSRVLVKDFKDIIGTNSLPCEIEVRKVKRYLVLA
jgi:hypothetical protein